MITAGKWYVAEDSFDAQRISFQVRAPDWPDDICVAEVAGYTREQALDNARMMAAAPSLYSPAVSLCAGYRIKGNPTDNPRPKTMWDILWRAIHYADSGEA